MNTTNPYFRATRMPYASVPLGAADISSGGPEWCRKVNSALSGVTGELFSNPSPLKLAVVGLVAYHGYKKKKSALAAAAWGLAAMFSPILAGGYALYEVVEKNPGGTARQRPELTEPVDLFDEGIESAFAVVGRDDSRKRRPRRSPKRRARRVGR